MDNPWIIHGLSMDNPWIIHGLSMDNCAISRSIKVPYLPSDKKITRSTLNSKIDKVSWRKVASTFLGPATVISQVPAWYQVPSTWSQASKAKWCQEPGTVGAAAEGWGLKIDNLTFLQTANNQKNIKIVKLPWKRASILQSVGFNPWIIHG